MPQSIKTPSLDFSFPLYLAAWRLHFLKESFLLAYRGRFRLELRITIRGCGAVEATMHPSLMTRLEVSVCIPHVSYPFGLSPVSQAGPICSLGVAALVVLLKDMEA
jgi:hypothetical protein